MTTITLPCYDIVILLDEGDGEDAGRYGGGTLTSALSEESGDGHPELGAALDAIESLVLAHAVAGIDVASAAYLEGIETAVDAAMHEFG
jgi:hypothetical protein